AGSPYSAKANCLPSPRGTKVSSGCWPAGCAFLRCNISGCKSNYQTNNACWSCVLLIMDQPSQRPGGKITVHGMGLGAPTPEQVEKRAREIALIDEREPNQFTDADWEQARRELLGEPLPPPPEESEEAAKMQEEW